MYAADRWWAFNLLFKIFFFPLKRNNKCWIMKNNATLTELNEYFFSNMYDTIYTKHNLTFSLLINFTRIDDELLIFSSKFSFFLWKRNKKHWIVKNNATLTELNEYYFFSNTYDTMYTKDNLTFSLLINFTRIDDELLIFSSKFSFFLWKEIKNIELWKIMLR